MKKLPKLSLIFGMLLAIHLSLKVFPAYSFETVTFTKSIAGFKNYAASNEALILSSDNQAYWLNGETLSNPTHMEIAPECLANSQGTSFVEEGLTLGFPFMVGLGRICLVENFRSKLSFLGSFPIPANAFSVAYLGATNSHSFFVINHKPNALGGTNEFGQLSTLSIDKTSLTFEISPLVLNVPGFSGAMQLSTQDGQFLLTEASGEFSNNLYSLNLQLLLQAAEQKQALDFSSVAELIAENFEGLSFNLLSNENSYLYLNIPGYDNYTVDKITKQQQVFQNDNCLPILGIKSHWLAICSGNTLQTISTSHN